MLISVDTRKLWEYNLTPSQYVFLYCLNKGENNILIDTNDLQHLIQLDYVKKSTTNWIITAKGLAIIEDYTSDLEDFVEQYRNIFPKGIKSGNGTPIRGDRVGCVKKMKWFLDNYPEFSKTIILEATKRYVDSMKQKGFAYVTQADYFINKDGASKLAASCEEWNIKQGINTGEKKL